MKKLDNTRRRPVQKKEFIAYEEVRQAGAYNMIAQSREAASAAGLSIERYTLVLKEYEKCMIKWPEVRS